MIDDPGDDASTLCDRCGYEFLVKDGRHGPPATEWKKTLLCPRCITNLRTEANLENSLRKEPPHE